MKIVLNNLLIICFCLFSGVTYALPSAKVTLMVVDEDRIPIEGAEVEVAFWQGGSEKVEQDVTDDDGVVVLSNNSIRHISYSVIKSGYYRTWNEYDFTDLSGVLGFRRWQPWNPQITVVLKKKIKPVSLYVKSLMSGESIKIPKLNEPIGFDLKEGDWVVPYGSGVYKDFIFQLKGKVISSTEYDLTLELSFLNDGDGIQSVSANPRFGSELRLSHQAPMEGYKKKLVQRYARTPKSFLYYDFPEDRNYFFRVRTEKDEEGNVISALYGKIHGNIKYDFEEKVSFQYYLNPNPNDRNLEFDYQKNLFDTRDQYGRYKEFSP